MPSLNMDAFLGSTVHFLMPPIPHIPFEDTSGIRHLSLSMLFILWEELSGSGVVT